LGSIQPGKDERNLYFKWSLPETGLDIDSGDIVIINVETDGFRAGSSRPFFYRKSGAHSNKPGTGVL
jgi:hypothetical protein